MRKEGGWRCEGTGMGCGLLNEAGAGRCVRVSGVYGVCGWVGGCVRICVCVCVCQSYQTCNASD